MEEWEEIQPSASAIFVQCRQNSNRQQSGSIERMHSVAIKEHFELQGALVASAWQPA
jgi:hypothetical protein